MSAGGLGILLNRFSEFHLGQIQLFFSPQLSSRIEARLCCIRLGILDALLLFLQS